MENFENMSIPELEAHKSQIDALIARKHVENREKAMAAAREAAKQFGFSIAQLFPAAEGKPVVSKSPSKKEREPGDAKYVHPSDQNLTWTGRGRQPKWFSEMLAKQIPRESLLIKTE